MNIKMKCLLYLILGLIIGETVSFFLVGVLSARRATHYELINAKLRRQKKRLADSMPEEARKNLLGADRCVCCGEPIPEGQMVCNKCLRDSL